MTEARQSQFERGAPRPRHGRYWLALLLLLSVSGFAIYRSTLFRLENVDIVGARRLTADRILEVAGLQKGDARWEHPASAIQQRLEQEPWVKSASVAWSYNRLTVKLQEREAVGLLRYADLSYLALDDRGLILEQMDAKAAKGLPVVTGVALPSALRGESVTNQALLDGLTLVARMSSALRAQVSELNVDADRNINLYMATGATVLWGRLDDGRDRVALAEVKLKLFGDAWSKVPASSMKRCRLDMRVSDKAIGADCGF